MGSIVLVHGAWHGPWCWDQVASGLRERGERVETPELHRGSLSADTAAVQEAIDGLGGDVVVCGHSYGGAVISGLRPDGLSHMVFLAALVLDSGESVLSRSSGAPATILSDSMTLSEDGTSTVVADRIAGIFYGDCAPDAQQAAQARLQPQAMACFQETSGPAAWRQVDSTYVVCQKDQAIHPELQRAMAALTTRQVEWPTSHSPFLSQPDRVVDLLAGLVRAGRP